MLEGLDTYERKGAANGEPSKESAPEASFSYEVMRSAPDRPSIRE